MEDITTVRQSRRKCDKTLILCCIVVVLLIIRTTSVLLDLTCLVSEACVWWGAAMQPLTGGDAGVVIGAILLVCVTAVPDVADYNVLPRMSWFYLQQGSAVSVGRRSSSILKYASSARLSCAPSPRPALTAGNTERRDIRGQGHIGSFHNLVRSLGYICIL